MEDYFKFELLPVDLKTQVFSFIRFTDWVLILSKVCSEWSHLCKSTTLPKVLDMRELLPPNYHDFYNPNLVLLKCLKLGQQYNITGLVADALFEYKNAKLITKALPKLSWLMFFHKFVMRSQRVTAEVPLTNSVTHLDSATTHAMKFEQIPVCFPNLLALNFSAGVTLKTLQTMPQKFEKIKVLRTGIKLDQKVEKKKRLFKRRRTAGENVGQLIEFIAAFKNIAPALTELYMFWQYKRDSKPADLKREFEAVEEAAQSKGIRLYCRDLVLIMKAPIVADPNAEFFLECFRHNNLPYKAYTFNGYTLLQHAIASLNIPVIRALFEHKLTNMEYEISAQNEFARVGPQPPCLTDSAQPHPFPISFLIPYANSPQTTEIVGILAENGYDVSKMVNISQQKIVSTPVWSKLNFSALTVRALFENYTRPIKWFDKANDGQTIAHKIVTVRGTPVFLDLMEKQLTKQEISDLMAVPDNKGNTPVHLFSDSSVTTIDRLIPYVKHCWDLKNKRDRTPLGQYMHRCENTQISVKEPKLRRFLQETPKIADNDVYELYRICGADELIQVLPLLAQKGANLTATGKDGLGLLFVSHSVNLYEEFKKHGVDLTFCDDNGTNLLHGIFMEDSDADPKELVEYLVKAGVNINQMNKYGTTPLIKAIQKWKANTVEIVETMLKNGADPNLHGPNAFSPLITALEKHNTSQKHIPFVRTQSFPKKDKTMIVKLLEHGAKPTSVKSAPHCLNPLALSIVNATSAKLIRLLLAHGADVHERDDAGNSMLHVTSDISLKAVGQEKYEKVVDCLLQHIDINDRNNFGETVLHQSIGTKSCVDYLISKGADMNARDCLGSTPLILADDVINFDVIDSLVLSPKLDLLAVNHEGKTALHVMVKTYEHRLKPFMTRFNAMSSEQQSAIKKIFATNDGVHPTALHDAISMRDFESVKICVEVFGLSPAMQHQISVIHLIDSPGTKDLAATETLFNYLIEHGADINAQNHDGDTPLHCAVQQFDNPYWIKFMLDKGADPKIKNKAGKSVNDLMPNLSKIRTGAMCFATEVPMSVEERAEKDKENEEEFSISDEDDTGLDEDDEMAELFNSDDMDENDVNGNDMNMHMGQFAEEFMEDLANMMPGEEDEEDDEDMDEHNNNNNNSDDDDDEDDFEDRPRRGQFIFNF